MQRPLILSATAVLVDAEHMLHDAAVVVAGDRVVRVAPVSELSSELHAEGERLDLGDVLLAPGLVNAHAHLELGALGGRCPAGADMVTWVGAVLRAKADLSPADYAESVDRGARRLLETGTTTVGDIDSTGASEARLPASGLRARIYREVLDGRDPARTPGELERLREDFPAQAASCVASGVSPHAPHTVSPELMSAAVEHARSEGCALSLHLAESLEEVEWLARGQGPFSSLLGASPHASGARLLVEAGIAGVPFSVVHANHVDMDELRQLVDRGGVVVHCPGTHAFFERGRVPLQAWLEAGATLALGSDSLASNADLDLRREMALVSEAHPELGDEAVLRMATEGGAAALGLSGRIGALVPGAFADVVAFDAPTSSRREALACLTRLRPSVKHVWVGGEAT